MLFDSGPKEKRKGFGDLRKNEYQMRKDIQPSRISSTCVEAPFIEGREKLEKEGYRVISLEENARLRIIRPFSNIDKGNYVREGMLYIPNKGMYITKNSPLVDFSNQERWELESYETTEEELEHALRDSLLIPTSISEINIPTDRLDEEIVPVYLFGNWTRDYGEYLKDKNIRNLKFSFRANDKERGGIYKETFRNQGDSFVRPIFFGGLKENSEVVDENETRVRGIKGLPRKK